VAAADRVAVAAADREEVLVALAAAVLAGVEQVVAGKFLKARIKHIRSPFSGFCFRHNSNSTSQ
jgi:hypothetical protein